MSMGKLCALILLICVTSCRILSAEHVPRELKKTKLAKHDSKHTRLSGHKHHHKKSKNKRKLNEMGQAGGEVDDVKHLRVPGVTKENGDLDENNIDMATGEQMGRELMLSEVEYPQIGIVNLDSGDFLLNIS